MVAAVWMFFAQMQASLLGKSPRHTHAQPHTEKLLEGKVQEMGPGCLQVAMAWMAMFGGSQWGCSSPGLPEGEV